MQQAMGNITTIQKEIRYDRQTRDFAVFVNGELIGYAASYVAGERLADEYVTDGLRYGTLGPAEWYLEAA